MTRSASAAAAAAPNAGQVYARLQKSRWWLMLALALAILVAMLADFTLGPSGLALPELLQTLLHPQAADPTTPARTTASGRASPHPTG